MVRTVLVYISTSFATCPRWIILKVCTLKMGGEGENPKIVLKRLQMGQCQEINEELTYEINPIRHDMYSGEREGRKSRGESQRELEKACADI